MKLHEAQNRNSLESPLFSLDIVINGTQYGLFGVAHDFVTGAFYERALESALSERNNWIMEEGMGLALNVAEGVEVAGGAANSIWDDLKEGASIGLACPRLFFYYIRLLRKIINPNDAVRRERVEIEGLIKKIREPVKPYSHIERRSGYYAEFMKAWKNGQDKNIICGAFHVPQIAYFLNNQIEDSRVIDLASSHAELLEQHPEKFKLLRRMFLFRNLSAIGAGVCAGILPYYLALDYLLKP